MELQRHHDDQFERQGSRDSEVEECESTMSYLMLNLFVILAIGLVALFQKPSTIEECQNSKPLFSWLYLYVPLIMGDSAIRVLQIPSHQRTPRIATLLTLLDYVLDAL